jgi:ribosomal protein S18 acetylase RimI-like enzyme
MDDIDRDFIKSLNARLTAVINAPTHSREEVVAFQERFTDTSWSISDEENQTFLAVTEAGLRLGYINVRAGTDEITNETCGYIALLAVAKNAEGQGVGQALLTEAERWARNKGFARLALDVFSSNVAGQSFYEKAGYQPETIRVVKSL